MRVTAFSSDYHEDFSSAGDLSLAESIPSTGISSRKRSKGGYVNITIQLEGDEDQDTFNKVATKIRKTVG